jgi:maleamate amidohydrolase
LTPPRLGPGERPAVLVVDFARGWTDPESPLAGDFDLPVAAATRLLDAARRKEVPVLFTTVAYEEQELDEVLMLRKTPRVRALRTGSPLTEIDPRLRPGDGEPVLVKKHASAFFGTSLEGELRSRGVDTLLVAGCITSGCIRTTACDAAQFGFRPLVVRDAVGDRSTGAHEAALEAIDALYGDVVSLAEACAVIERG